MENLIHYFYKNELVLAEKEHREKFYLLAGYDLTIGLIKSIKNNTTKNVSFESILELYKMDTQDLYKYVSINEPSIPELYSLVVLSIEVFGEVQDRNNKLFSLNNLNK